CDGAFLALPPMSTSAGRVPTAVYGFTSMLAIVLASRPEYAIAALDLGKPTFRSQEYEQYKAGRRAMPDDLRPQMYMVREVLEAFSIPIHGVEGFEADDVIGTLARIGEERGHSVTIVSGDLDCLQLVTESVEALVPRRGITDTFVYGPDQVRQRYRFEPPQLIDGKARRGDTSENIPGGPGVGGKTAPQLVQEFVTGEALPDGRRELPGRRRPASGQSRIRPKPQACSTARRTSGSSRSRKAPAAAAGSSASACRWPARRSTSPSRKPWMRWPARLPAVRSPVMTRRKPSLRCAPSAGANAIGRSAPSWPRTSWGRDRAIPGSKTSHASSSVWSSSAASSCWAPDAPRASRRRWPKPR